MPFLSGPTGMGGRVPLSPSLQVSDPVTQIDTSALAS